MVFNTYFSLPSYYCVNRGQGFLSVFLFCGRHFKVMIGNGRRVFSFVFYNIFVLFTIT